MGAVVLCAGACRMQSLLYPAPSFRVPSPPPPPLVEVPLEAPSGAVSAWWLASEDAPAPAILFLHGNGENLETMRRSGFFEAAATLGASVLAIDYPGYGRSAGRPSEAANVAAVEAALDWLGPRRPVVLSGWSLGAAVAMQAAARRPESFDGLALLSAWTSLADVARVHYPGRMPGHMNVLLAEANVPYDQIFDLDDINDEFARTDAVLVVGANDVVNPAAKTNPGSPIYGMPVFNVEQARAVIVLKRSYNPGFSGIENDLFGKPNTMMVLGDAKKTLREFVAGLKG